jgi:hypothetical protein
MSASVSLLLALGLPLLLVVGLTLVLMRHREHLPPLLQRLSRREAMLWNIGIGLLISMSALRYLLSR